MSFSLLETFFSYMIYAALFAMLTVTALMALMIGSTLYYKLKQAIWKNW